MIYDTTSLNRKIQGASDIKDDVQAFVRRFWAFSQFYGIYNATPVHKRQLMLDQRLEELRHQG
jgi:hypothetical protein